MEIHAVNKVRAGMPWRYCVISLIVLLIVTALPACSGGGSESSCTGDSEEYQGRCLPHVMAIYLKCVKDIGFSLSNEVSGGVTLPMVADSTFKLAYKRSKEEDSAAALQKVHDCLTLAEQNATSGTDRATARQYAQQAARYGDVVQHRLPAIELDPSGTLDCGSTQMPCNVMIKSTGVVALHITYVEVIGANSGDFTAGDECKDKWLDPNQSCMMSVQFQPSGSGERNATLVIHQNLPPPDHGTQLQLTGTGTGSGSPPGGHTLTVTVDASAAQVEVTSSPSGIDCPGTCNGTFGDGTDITLTAKYDHASGQVTWEGCDTPNGDECTLSLTADRTVTAHL